MKRLLSLGLALAAVVMLPASALAINAYDGQNAFEVFLLSARDDEYSAGEWYLELDGDSGDRCDYALEWVSPFGGISTDCLIQELKVHGRKSCIRNARRNFPTFVHLHPDFACEGFSDLALLETVDALVLTESRSGMSGVILLSGGAVYGVDIRER